MFINSVPQYQPACTFKCSPENRAMQKRCKMLTQQYIMNPKHSFKWPENQAEKSAFSETLKNLYRLMLSQDIWDSSLKVKWPETPEEKNTLLEILGFRAQLDRFVQLSHRRFNVMHDETISAENRTNTLNAINKKIDEEKKRHSEAFTFMEQLNDLDDEYVEGIQKNGRKLQETEKSKDGEDEKPEPYVTTNMLRKYWDQVVSNNINKDGTMSVQDLIKYIENGEKPLTKAELYQERKVQEEKRKAEVEAMRAKIAEEYKNTLINILNIYSPQTSHFMDSMNARIAVMKSLGEELKNFPEITEGDLIEIYKKAEEKVVEKVNKLIDIRKKVNGKLVTGIDIYPIGEYWKIMDECVTEAKKAKAKMEEIRPEFNKRPDDPKLKAEMDMQIRILAEAKENWYDLLKESVEKEYKNREIFDGYNRLKDYEELADNNPIILRFRGIYDIAKKNDDSIPEKMWDEIFK